MKNIVIGTGSIGKRHIKNLLSLGEDVIAYDISETNLSNVKEQFGISVYNDIDDCLKKADQGMNAFICTPAPSHIYYAQKCADLKMDLFVEKPLADSMEGLDKLVHTINANNLVSLVGCNMRFDRGLSILKQLLEKKKNWLYLFSKSRIRLSFVPMATRNGLQRQLCCEKSNGRWDYTRLHP